MREVVTGRDWEPKVTGQVNASVDPRMRVFGLLLRPMAVILSWIAFGFVRLLGIPDPSESASLYTFGETALATRETAASGRLDHVRRGSYGLGRGHVGIAGTTVGRFFGSALSPQFSAHSGGAASRF